jgi:hypothetical protein
MDSRGELIRDGPRGWVRLSTYQLKDTECYENLIMASDLADSCEILGSVLCAGDIWQLNNCQVRS